MPCPWNKNSNIRKRPRIVKGVSHEVLSKIFVQVRSSLLKVTLMWRLGAISDFSGFRCIFSFIVPQSLLAPPVLKNLQTQDRCLRAGQKVRDIIVSETLTLTEQHWTYWRIQGSCAPPPSPPIIWCPDIVPRRPTETSLPSSRHWDTSIGAPWSNLVMLW